MYQIQEIYRIPTSRTNFAYIGTLRNGKKFNLGADIFVNHAKSEIVRGRIIGVELPPVDNADYIYKVQIPENVIQQAYGFTDDEKIKFYEGKDLSKITVQCDKIFTNIEEAKQSAIDNETLQHKLTMEAIYRYFGQF